MIRTKIGFQDKNNTNNKIKRFYQDLKNINLESISHNSLIFNLCSVKNPISKKRKSMIKFDIIHSGLRDNQETTTRDQEISSIAANLKHRST